MRRFLSVFWLGFFLTGCENPAPTGDREDKAAPVSPNERRGNRSRDPSPEAPQTPREIMETADKLESPPAREKALADVAWDAIETDPALAHEAFLRLPTDSPEKIRLIQHYAQTLAEGDVEAALEWAAAIGSEAEIAAAKAQIALAIAEADPYRAANLLSESGIEGREFDVAVVQVIQRWAAKSASEAAGWVTFFPPGPARKAGIGIIAGQWLPKNPSAAFAWLDSLQDLELRKETAHAMEGVILQQPENIRNAWLQHADVHIQSELEQQREQAIKDVGDNIRALAK